MRYTDKQMADARKRYENSDMRQGDENELIRMEKANSEADKIGFTTVNTKDVKMASNKDRADAQKRYNSSDMKQGDENELIEMDITNSQAKKTLGASRFKARQAQMDREKIAEEVKSANYLNIKDKK
jgi:hypothetical protein